MIHIKGILRADPGNGPCNIPRQRKPSGPGLPSAERFPNKDQKMIRCVILDVGLEPCRLSALLIAGGRPPTINQSPSTIPGALRPSSEDPRFSNGGLGQKRPHFGWLGSQMTTSYSKVTRAGGWAPCQLSKAHKATDSAQESGTTLPVIP